MSRLTYLHNRNGHYYFRMALPQSAQQLLGQKELIYSLSTKSFPEARLRCMSFARIAQEVLMTLKMTILSPEEAKKLVKEYFSEAQARLKQQIALHESQYVADVNDGTGETWFEAYEVTPDITAENPRFLLPDSAWPQPESKERPTFTPEQIAMS